MDRALIIKKEYLDKILDGLKVWELRSTRTSVRGKIGLIESGSGMIVGECEITLCTKLPDSTKWFKNHYEYHRCDDPNLLKKYSYAWVIKNAKRYDKPIPYDHPQGAVIWVKIDHIVETNKKVDEAKPSECLLDDAMELIAEYMSLHDCRCGHPVCKQCKRTKEAERLLAEYHGKEDA